MMGEWNSVPLANLASFYSGGTPSKEKAIYWGGSTPWVTVKDMKSMRLNIVSKSLTEQGADTVRVVPAGTVLVLVRGMSLFKDLPVALCNQPVTFNQDIKGLVAKQNVDSEYLAFALIARKSDILRHVESSGHGTGRLDTDLLKSTLLKSTPLPLPPLPEQRKIAEILRTWDRAIELTSALLAATRTRKRGLMQILLTGKCRFPEFAGQPWREVRLGEVASIDQQSLRSGTAPGFIFDYISLSDVESGKIVETLQRFTFEKAPSRARRIVKPGDLLVSTVRPNLQGFARVMERHQGCVASTGFAVITPKAEVNGSYLFHYLFSRHMESQFYSLVVGSNYPAVNSSDVEKLKVCLPLVAEQAKIGSLLDSCDKEMIQLGAQIEALRIQKRGLMQKLLTGEWRVPLGSATMPTHTGS